MSFARLALFSCTLFLMPTASFAKAKSKKAEKVEKAAVVDEEEEGDEDFDEAAEKATKAKSSGKAAKATKAAAAEPETEEAKKPASEDAEPAATAVSPLTQGRFNIRRGFFAEGDLGVFLTFGGRNSNNIDLPQRATSNFQPHLGLVVGYDVAHGPSHDLSLGLRFAMGLSGGASRATLADAAENPELVGTKSNDFSVTELGLQAAFSYLVTDRFALTFKGDGGAGFVSPDPTRFADDPKAGSAAFAPVFGVGMGFEYFTLLNDFSTGVTVRFQGILLDGLIPAASITLPIKYTF